MSSKTYLNWETDRTSPMIRFWPAIIGYLGEYPFTPPTTLGARLREKRRRTGWTYREAAAAAGIDEGTWRETELSGDSKTARMADFLDRRLGS